MQIYEELQARGLLAQVTDEDKIRDLVNNGKATFYIGFDPTADSLHVGHFMALTLMKRLQLAGNKPIALVGGGTAMIGDPSGRTDMRSMMTIETIDHNVECFKKQMSRFIEFGEGKARIVNNADWLRNLNFLDFMREIGPCFSVNEMLRARCYVNRLEKGLSFLEFSYMLMQSYDFLRLYEDYGCNMEFGGDDQWSNMLGGTDLIRRKLGKDAFAMTIALLLKHDGTKMGKTAGGAVWLDANKTTPYEFYQYWRNVDDADVLNFLRKMTFLPLEQIEEMDKWEGSQLNEAKRILAHELTTMVHGEEETEKAEAAAKALFGGGADAEIPTTELTEADFEGDTIDILGVLVKAGLCATRSEARRNVTQGGVSVEGTQVTDFKATFTKADLAEGKVFKRGKKNFRKVILK
ncbi:tyrosine--tRNA ligase [[Clostridium] aminophilum]|uniref:Tyrosine--tRNA ligase n=1 Tax=[Clostridium] aminophilum TaxID=1526 RepID=A0A1I0FEW7_9FIRM|nr:tyrosine--tRNA ligase [[Clostridium] aminophilum]SET56816.1 tyrosyl-tRNA synthetase [[Clostridium] aminophilum]SFR82591.1 tyrosyl-tRNA synthetase [[Clostridium] aminophilum]